MAKATSNRREFLQLADTFKLGKFKIAGFLISEKLDGTRCFWDGGISRGLRTETVPYASVTDPKTGQKKGKVKPYATGLWSRYGNPILAPDWFLNALPCCPLDGELWAGRGNFQLCRSICGGDDPDPRFDKIQYAVYSSPCFAAVFGSGEIKNTNMHATFDRSAIEKWVNKHVGDRADDFKSIGEGMNFDSELMFLREFLEAQNDRVFLHQQVRLPEDEEQAMRVANEFMEKVLERGGEGAIMRDPKAIWTPKRHKGLLKYKPFDDSEGRLVGFTSGRQTDKGSKLLGKIGALILDFDGKRLELSGLTDEEREFAHPTMTAYAKDNPGVDMPAGFEAKHFKLGDSVSFKYRELSDDLIPKEARYFRKRDVE